MINSGRHDRGYLWIFGGQKELLGRNFFYGENELTAKLSCDVVYFLIALLIIDIYFDLYLSVVSEIIETHTITNNGKLFNEWITQK